jgi:hypothetical protein
MFNHLSAPKPSPSKTGDRLDGPVFTRQKNGCFSTHPIDGTGSLEPYWWGILPSVRQIESQLRTCMTLQCQLLLLCHTHPSCAMSSLRPLLPFDLAPLVHDVHKRLAAVLQCVSSAKVRSGHHIPAVCRDHRGWWTSPGRVKKL